MTTRAVLLLSGGLDSTTLLAIARDEGREIHALSFDYGQRHAIELEVARRQAARFGVVAHERVDLRAFAGLVAGATALVAQSALSVPKTPVPEGDPNAREIPSTYVPARNPLFLSYALAWAEAIGAVEIWIGANALDYSGYPDCRPDFLEAWSEMASLATRAGREGRAIQLRAPLLELEKRGIIERGLALGVDYAETVSCYDPRGDVDGAHACGSCESCRLRRRAFEAAGIPDPTRYRL